MCSEMSALAAHQCWIFLRAERVWERSARSCAQNDAARPGRKARDRAPSSPTRAALGGARREELRELLRDVGERVRDASREALVGVDDLDHREAAAPRHGGRRDERA